MEPGALHDLPLFRMPWTSLPGVVQVLQVSGPEWVHMFEDLVAAATAQGRAHARFGHLARSNATAPIQLSARAFTPDSDTPLVGTLMEVREMRRLSGGRLVVVAHAMSRFRVLRPTRTAPYPRADVMALPDEEEVGQTGLLREGGLPTSSLPRHWRAEAARAAAAAASLAWAEAEIDARSYLGVIEPTIVNGTEGTLGGVEDPSEALPLGLLRRPGEEYTNMNATTDSEAVSSSAGEEAESSNAPESRQNADDAAALTMMRQLARLDGGVDVGSTRELEDLAPFNLRLSIGKLVEQARRAAIAAAEEALGCVAASASEPALVSLGPLTGTSPLSFEPVEVAGEMAVPADGVELYMEEFGVPVLDGLNTAVDNIQLPTRLELGPDEASHTTGPPRATNGVPTVRLPSAAFAYSPPFLLALEQSIWSELVQCLALSQRAKARTAGADADAAGGSVSLPHQLLVLIPPPPRHGWPAGMPDAPASAQWLQRWGYPPVRRAQRLSYLIAAGLPVLLGAADILPPQPVQAGAEGLSVEEDGWMRNEGVYTSLRTSAALDRQTLLQASSVRERLQAAVVYLCHQRQRLVALAALKSVATFDQTDDLDP